MKKIILLVFVVLTMFAAAQAQSAIAPEKKKLIAEIISVTKADKQTEGVMRAMFDQMDASYSGIVEATLAKRTELSPAAKNALKAEMIRQRSGATRFTDRLMQKMNFQDFIEKTMYPLYDKFFTETELRDLLAFYKSPTGQKLVETTPQLAGESMRVAQEYLIPKIGVIVEELIQEDISGARKTPQPKKN